MVVEQRVFVQEIINDAVFPAKLGELSAASSVKLKVREYSKVSGFVVSNIVLLLQVRIPSICVG
jgi:hypothetical protein